MMPKAKLVALYNTTTIGAHAENEALRYLERNGLKLIARNYKIKGGEIDLIMQDQEFTVFIEVKFRQSEIYGDAPTLVTPQKRQRLIRAAKTFLLEKNEYDTAHGRFDIIAIFADHSSEITWIKNAFEVNY